MPAEPTGAPRLDDVLARLPHLTVHLVDLPERYWVADPAAMTVWVHKATTAEQRDEWVSQAASAILAQHGEGPTRRPGPRLHSVGRR